MSELIYKQQAIDTIYNTFSYAYCNNCENNGKDNDSCDECHRKYQNWAASRNTIESVINALPSVEPKIIHCKDCRNRGEDECPMRHVERIEWEEDGYIEVDDIVHDYTEPHGYCDKGERNERFD